MRAGGPTLALLLLLGCGGREPKAPADSDHGQAEDSVVTGSKDVPDSDTPVAVHTDGDSDPDTDVQTTPRTWNRQQVQVAANHVLQ